MAAIATETRHSTTERPFLMLAVVFIACVLIATVWGAIVQTQFNIAGLSSLGVDISAGVRLETTLRDIFSGFMPATWSRRRCSSLFSSAPGS